MIAIISNAGGFITIGYFNNVIPRGCKIHQLIEDATITPVDTQQGNYC